MIPVWAIALIVVSGVGVTMITVSVTVSTPETEVMLECYGMFNGTTMYTDTLLSIPWNTRVKIPCKANVETIDRMNYTEAYCGKVGDAFVLERGPPCETNSSYGCDTFPPKLNEYIMYSKPNNTRHVHIYCNDGYTIAGTTAAVCVTTTVGTQVTSMEWNPANIAQSSSCTPGTCPTIVISDATISDSSLVTGESADISCNTNFYLSDVTLKKVYCNAVANSTKVTLSAIPTCKPYQCAPPVLTIPNTFQIEPGPVNVGSTTDIGCNAGYSLTPFQANAALKCEYIFNNATVKITGYNNTLTFTCAPANCSKLTVANSDTTNVILGLNQQRAIKCTTGFMLVPNQIVGCHPVPSTTNGELVPASSVCTASQCPSLPVVTNGKWNSATVAFPASNVGVVATLTCNANFKVSPVGATMVTTCTGILNVASLWLPAVLPPTCIAV